MLTKEEWFKNVGTHSYPISYLHEYAIGLIWDLLNHRDTRLNNKHFQEKLSGTVWEGVMVGVERVVLPDSIQPIAGFIPDLALLDKEHKVVRVIEVVTTNPPNSDKLKTLADRGIEVLQVPVRTETDLRALFPGIEDGNGIKWWHHLEDVEQDFGDFDAQRQADRAVDQFMRSLTTCSPSKRVEFLGFLKDMSSSLESLYPLRPDNPKKQ